MLDSSVEIKNLIKKFPNETSNAIDNLSLNLAKGKITGLIGPDAAGKTTLIRLIVGLLSPTEGEILTLGLNPAQERDLINAKIGYMPQKFGLYEDLSVIENLTLYAELKGIQKDDAEALFEKLLTMTDLNRFRDRLAGALSGGMKQKLGLACSLLGSPELLLLDEPSVGVDPISRRELMKMVRELTVGGITVLWSTAYLEEAHSFDDCIVLNEGKIIYNGKPHELSETTAGFEVEVIKLMGGYEPKESLLAKNFELKENNGQYVIEALDLVKKYGDFYAVKNNTFHIKKGEIFGLLGPNGAGKSTSFKMMCGLATPTAGTAKIMGQDILKNPSKARSHLGYMAQKFSLYGGLSVYQNLEFFAGIYGLGLWKRREKIEEIIDIFHFKKYLNSNAQTLPLGYKQRLSLACAVMHNPPVLFLDEPTSGVDPITRMEFWNHITALSKKGVTVMVTTHFMEEAEYCDRISLFYKGETIAMGTPSGLKASVAPDATMEDAFIGLIQKYDEQVSQRGNFR